MILAVILLVTQLAAAPLLKPLEQPALVELGAPPCCPENPYVQYWHTMDVPTEAGVFPVEVFAPRLVAQMASEPEVATPEPGTAWLAGGVVVAVVFAWWWVRRNTLRALDEWELGSKKAARYSLALNEIYWNSSDDAAKQIARKALEE